ncbi:MAG TPA: hypothetical protein VL096_14040 [Pirellulaceae bacterium]|nr:hypothetical protein [Pirellulaceae bacterium]
MPAAGETPAVNLNSSATGATATLPDAIVTSFLESLRAGNDTVAAALLTQKAREETQQKGLKVQPPGTPDMKYEIGQTEYVTEAKDGAHVGSVWTEKLEDGSTASFDVIWVLRLEPQGWRIAGMATPAGENQPPLFLNFEDPDDLLRKWQATETEMAGPADAAVPANGQLVPTNGQFVPANSQFETNPAGGQPIQNAEIQPDQNPLR